MSYIGKSPAVGNFVKLDAITTSSTNTYNLTVDSVAFVPESANHMLVSLNGVIQAPLSSFSVSGSTITFLPASGTLTSSDSIDFIMVYGNVLDIGVPSDNTVSLAKLTATGTKDATTFLRGDNTFATPTDNGKVLQVVSTTKTDTQTISTSSATQISGLTASLTCASTSNKVLITGVLSVGGTTNDAGYTIYAGGSAITAATGDAAGSRRRTTFGGGAFLGTGNETYRVYTIPFSFLYSPSSTSAITYSIYKTDSGATATYINRSATDNDAVDRQRAISTITLMEIAG